MRAVVCILAAIGLLVALATPAVASPRMTGADRNEISAVIDRFVKDVVLRRNLADGWQLAGPDLRGGTTRKAWVAGTGVTVAAFPASGTSFRNAWSGNLISPTHAVLSMIMHPKAGSSADETSVSVDVRKTHRRWVVDSFYTAAVYRSGNNRNGSCGRQDCAISGQNDFGPAAATGAVGSGKSHIGAHWVWIAIGTIGALMLAGPFLIVVRLKHRDRRARAAHTDRRRTSV